MTNEHDGRYRYASPRLHGGAKLKVQTLCVLTDRPTFLKSRLSDSARPTDRPAARSAAKQIWGRNNRPTDPLGPRPSRSEAVFDRFLWSFGESRLLAGGSDQPTDPTPTDSGQSDLPTDRPTRRPPLIRRVYFQLRAALWWPCSCSSILHLG